MKARVQKWSNGLALRIPKSVATVSGLEEDTLVDMSLVQGKLIVRPVARKRVTLKNLLRRITDENRHEEMETGPRVGKEIW